MHPRKKKVSIITSVKNEEKNVTELVDQIKIIALSEKSYFFEHIIIDNMSDDSTREVLSDLSNHNKHLGILFNRRDFGSQRAIFHLLQTVSCDAAILITADFQEPLELIPTFLREWEKGNLVVGGVKKKSSGSYFLNIFREFYYKIISSISTVVSVKGFIGFGLYDRKVLNHFRNINDADPYIRALPSELGFKIKEIPYNQDARLYGKSKYTFLPLINVAIMGITSQSKAPMRFASILGSFLSLISILIAFFYFIMKIIYWDSFDLGLAPLIILVTFTFSVQILFLGLIGEYIAKINSDITKRPLVIEESRKNYPVEEYINDLTND